MTLSIIVLLQTLHTDERESEKSWQSPDSVWLVHKGGFSAVRVVKPAGSPATDGLAIPLNGRCTVKLEGGEVIEVDEDDIEAVRLFLALALAF